MRSFPGSGALISVLFALASCGGEGVPALPAAGGPAPADTGPAESGAPDSTARDARPADVAPLDVGLLPDSGTLRPETGDMLAAACPPQAELDLSWVTAYQRDVVARLTGAAEVEPGLSLTNRGTPVTRAAAARYLQKALGELGLSAQTQVYATGANVFARLDGTTGSAQHLVLGAHFDTVVRTPGANDNATGVALVLAVGQALGSLGCRSKSVLLVLFDEEEEGLVGSKQFARKLIADGTMVHSVHTADQLGWDNNGDRLIELERPDPGLRELYEAAHRGLGFTFPLMTTTTSGSDHASFRPTFPAVGLTEGYRGGDTSPHMHRPTDVLDTVDFAYLRSATTLVARTMADLVR